MRKAADYQRQPRLVESSVWWQCRCWH